MACEERVELSLACGALHRSLPRDSQGSARRGISQTLGRRHVAQPATDEGGAEAIARSGRIDLLDLEPSLGEPRLGVVIASAVGAALVNDRPNAAVEDFRTVAFSSFAFVNR